MLQRARARTEADALVGASGKAANSDTPDGAFHMTEGLPQHVCVWSSPGTTHSDKTVRSLTTEQLPFSAYFHLYNYFFLRNLSLFESCNLPVQTNLSELWKRTLALESKCPSNDQKELPELRTVKIFLDALGLLSLPSLSVLPKVIC